MKKRRERAFLFQLTGRARTVNRRSVDKVRNAIVQKWIQTTKHPFRRAQGLRRMTNDEARMVRAELALDEDENGGTRFGTSGHAEACPSGTIYREMSRCERRRKPSPCKTDAAHSESSTCMARAARPLGRVRSG